MIYTISDLHGLELLKLKELLQKADFCKKDTLYILGDVIDRQNDGGVEILQWIIGKTNIHLICGNHEQMLLSCKFLFEMSLDDSLEKLSEEENEFLNNYIYNGGLPTIKSLLKLKTENAEAYNKLIKYIEDAPLYKKQTVNGKKFLLCHSGLGNFEKTKKLEEYTEAELLWNRPDISEKYFEDIFIIFGHTPTLTFGKQHNGKILITDTWANIDVGVHYGNSPALFRIDDFKEIYL